jgi:uncharacterized phiE125 gp8 family phage protein
MYMPVDYWPNENWNHKEILLPKAPTQSVTSVQYYDTDDTLQTLPTSGYAVDTTRQPARIVLEDYPSLSTDKYPRVQITYVSGYTTVPTQLCHAILLLAADFYRCREARTEYRFSDLPLGFQGLIQTYRLHVLDYQL